MQQGNRPHPIASARAVGCRCVHFWTDRRQGSACNERYWGWAESSMPEYRVYTIGHMDQFIAVQSIECPDDQAAIRQARQMLDRHSLELWELERFIIRLDQPPTERNS